MKFRTISLSLLSLIFILFFVSCSKNIDTDNDKIKIIATIYPQYDFAKQICGEKADVSLLMLPGTDTHSFELGPSDAVNINKSDIFIYTGPTMEIWANSIVKSAPTSLRVLNLSDYTKLITDDHGKVDGHIWTSPVSAQSMLTAIYDAVCEVDPDNIDYYKDNYLKYLSKLDELDVLYNKLSSDAQEKIAYFCGSFAFRYLFQEYDFQAVAPFNSCSGTEIESLGDVSKIIDEIKTKNVKYVFYEANENDPLIDTIVSETSAEALPLHSIHGITETEYKNQVTYYELMSTNLVNLRKAFCYGETT